MKTYNITYIPPKPKMALSEVVYFYMLSLVPKGRLTRREDIEKYLAEKYGVYHVEFERPVKFDIDYWCDLVNKIPFHREVSSYGYTDEINCNKLSKEGFEFDISKTPTGRTKIKVKEYKKYLVNFKNDIQIDINILNRINVEEIFEANNMW